MSYARWKRDQGTTLAYTLEEGSFHVCGQISFTGGRPNRPLVYVWATGGSDRAHGALGGLELDEARDVASAILRAEDLIAAEYARLIEGFEAIG